LKDIFSDSVKFFAGECDVIHHEAGKKKIVQG